MQLGDQADRINGMLRAEKINMGNVAWLWKETNIWSGAACQSFDGCEKSSKKLYVLTDHPKALLAFPGTISLMLENILGEHKRTSTGQNTRRTNQNEFIFRKTMLGCAFCQRRSNVQFWCGEEAKQKTRQKQSHQTRRAWACERTGRRRPRTRRARGRRRRQEVWGKGLTVGWIPGQPLRRRRRLSGQRRGRRGRWEHGGDPGGQKRGERN